MMTLELTEQEHTQVSFLLNAMRAAHTNNKKELREPTRYYAPEVIQCLCEKLAKIYMQEHYAEPTV